MTSICMCCKRGLGEKEPLENHIVTDGICTECQAVLMVDCNIERRIQIYKSIAARYDEITRLGYSEAKHMMYAALEATIEQLDRILYAKRG